jgi:tetratricopeptide (TPR) repeat protein
MRFLIGVIAIIAAQTAQAAPKSPDWVDCDTGAPAQQVVSCGKIVAQGGEKPEDLAWVYYRRGNGYQDTGKPVEALADYARAAALNPKFSEPQNAAGTVHFDKGDYGKAIAAYDRALAIDPKNWRALNNKGNALRRANRAKEALPAFDAAIALQPAQPSILVNRGGARLDLLDFAGALTDLNAAIRADRSYADAYLLRALAFGAKGQFDKQLPDLNEFIRLRPQDSRGYEARGAFHFLSARDTAKAADDYDRAIALAPDSASNRLIRGNLFGLAGDDVSALKAYDKALSLKPDLAAALGARGTARVRREQYDSGIVDLERALAMDGSLGWVKLALDNARAAKAALAKRGAAKAGPPKLERRVALIVGNSKYVGISPLKNAARDAASIAGQLKAKGYQIFGYPKTDMTRAQMFDAIEAFQAAAATADTALVWYAGHGQEFDGDGDQAANWLIPVDFAANGDVARSGVPLSRLVTAASPARALRVVVVDACRNNDIPSNKRGARGFRAEERSDMLIVFSTRAGRLAEDGDGANSPFATAFLQELGESASLDVRQFFGGVAERMENLMPGQEPERIDRMKSRHTLSLAP